MRHLIQDKLIIKRNTLAEFPVTGDVDYLYLDWSTKEYYYWNGSAYVAVPTSSTILADYTNNFLLMGG